MLYQSSTGFVHIAKFFIRKKINCISRLHTVSGLYKQRQPVYSATRGIIVSRSMTMAQDHVMERCEETIERSPEDKRLYRYLKLKNNLKVMLISDPTTDKSAASMDVQIGSMSDPWDIPGIAHFCEHMLFLGTEKFPSENEYSKYLSEHSGGSNAYTAADHTNYYFDVAPDAFKGALDRFAQFFLCPLFTESCVEREVNIVNSEHEKNLSNDHWRLGQLEKATSLPTHPYSKFGTGNKSTLFDEPKKRGIFVRDVLLQFHKEWYSANAMGLSVLGKESLDELEEEVVTLFRGVEDKAVTIPTWPDHPFVGDGVAGYVVPVKDIRNLHITWPLPDLRSHYKSAPGHYLGHLIGHEAKGSLLSYLKEQGWVNSLVGGQKHGARGFSFFSVNVSLTEEGIEHVEDITVAVFEFLQLLLEATPQQWMFDELQKLSATAFRFKDKERPQYYVTNISESLSYYPPEEMLTASYLLSEFDAPLITSVLERLTPETARLAVVGKQMEARATQSEKWYGTKYDMVPVPEPMLRRWRSARPNPAFSLPVPNEFLPEQLELCTNTEGVTEVPQKILSTPLADIWYKQDTEYNLPKNNLYAELFSPIAYLNPRNTNMLHMFAQLFRDAMTEYSYDAELAGISYFLNNSKFGLLLCVRGYYDKQPLLVKNVMEKLVAFEVDSKRFAILKEAYVRALCNFNADQPHQHAAYYTSLLLCQYGWSKEELLTAAKEDLTVEALSAFIPALLSEMHCNLLVHGSVSREWALSLADLVTGPLLQRSPPTRSLLQHQLNRQREVTLSNGRSYSYQAENSIHSSSAIEVVLQGGLQSTRDNALFDLTSQILNEPAYDELRTKEQLGYIIWSGLRRSNGTQAFRVIIQSPFSPEYLDSRIEAFLVKMEQDIADMSEEDFLRHREALVQRRLEKPKKMPSLTMRWWAEIICNQYHFDRDTVEVDCIRSLSKADLLQHYKCYLSADGPCRAKLSVQVLSTAAGGAGSDAPKATPPQGEDLRQPPPLPQVVPVTCINTFKGDLSMFPLMKPYVAPTPASKL